MLIITFSPKIFSHVLENKLYETLLKRTFSSVHDVVVLATNKRPYENICYRRLYIFRTRFSSGTNMSSDLIVCGVDDPDLFSDPRINISTRA